MASWLPYVYSVHVVTYESTFVLSYESTEVLPEVPSYDIQLPQIAKSTRTCTPHYWLHQCCTDIVVEGVALT